MPDTSQFNIDRTHPGRRRRYKTIQPSMPPKSSREESEFPRTESKSECRQEAQ
jgi:hypothetical protein